MKTDTVAQAYALGMLTVSIEMSHEIFSCTRESKLSKLVNDK